MDERGLRLRGRRDSLIYGRDAEVAAWVQAHAPHAEKGFKDYVAVGLERDGRLIAGWVYDEYHGYCIRIAMASTTPTWCSKRVLREIFAYPFVQLPCVRVTVLTGKTMTSVRKFLERVGFVQEGLVRRGFADDDAVIYGMLREECRWIR